MKGVVAELDELIALKRFARKIHYKPDGKILRAGNHISRMRGRGMDFSEVRHYQMGDEIRHMEWRVTARTGRPHIKIYEEEKERPVFIVTNFNSSMHFGTRVAFKSVVAAHLTALIAWTVVKQGDKVGAFFYSDQTHSEFIPRTRESQVLPLLAALSHYTQQVPQEQPDPKLVLSEELLRLRRVAKPGSLIVLISDFYQMDSECEKQLSRLRVNNDILLYQISDVLELEPPRPAIYAITNGQQELLLDTTDKTVNHEYQVWCSTHRSNLQAQCKRLQIQYTNVTALHDLPKLVHQTFPRRRRG